MNDRDRHHLRSNREKLVKAIGSVNDVVGLLGSLGVLTENMEDMILSKPTKAERIRELVNLLQRRGEGAFDAFHTVLFDLNEIAAAKILKPEGSWNSAPRPTLRPLPSKFPDDNDDPELIKVTPCIRNYQDAIFHKFEQSSQQNCLDVYRMCNNPRGICLILNNEEFINHEPRIGTNFDRDGIKNLFKQLHFQCWVEDNKTRDEMRDILIECSKTDHTYYNCFVLFILSHGNEGCVLGVDGDKIELDEIIQMFHRNSTLKDKPKLFFIQACQGELRDNGSCAAGSESTMTPQETENRRNLISVITEKVRNLELSSKDKVDGKLKSDVFVSMATSPGFVSWRNIEMGSWFIQAILYAFKYYVHLLDLDSIMTKVNHLVQSAETQDFRNKQTPVQESSLNKSLYFFPGLYTQTPTQPSGKTHPAHNPGARAPVAAPQTKSFFPEMSEYGTPTLKTQPLDDSEPTLVPN